MKKQNKSVIATLVAVIILLSAISITSIIYNFLGGFYYCRVINFDKVLGEEQTIVVDRKGAFSCACNFSGSLVVGAEIKQPIYVQSNFNQDLYLRAKHKVASLNDTNGRIFGFSNWVEAKDGYIYYNQPIKPYERVGVFNTLSLESQMQLKSSTNYIVIFTVECDLVPWGYEAV